MDKTMSTTGTPAIAAADATSYALCHGSSAPMAGDLGLVQGRTVSAVGIATRERVAGFDATVPTTGSVYPRLEGPPV